MYSIGEGTFRNDYVVHRRTFYNLGCHAAWDVLSYGLSTFERIALGRFITVTFAARLKVHKNENFFGFDFEFCPISLLVMHK
jgi:hypothetical protein